MLIIKNIKYFFCILPLSLIYFYSISYANNINGLIAYYKFDSNTNDIVNDNNLLNYNSILTKGPFEKDNSAYYFNGTDSYLVIDDTSQKGLDITTNFTIAIIVKINKQPIDDVFTFVNKGKPDGTNGGFGFDYANINSQNRLRVYWYGPQKFSRVYTNVDLCLDKWYHIIVSADIQSIQANFYIDGKYYDDIIENNDAVSIIDNNEEFRVGSYGKDSFGADAKRYLDGSIGEIRIYNRKLLKSEIDKHWFTYSQFDIDEFVEDAVNEKDQVIVQKNEAITELNTKMNSMFTETQLNYAITTAISEKQQRIDELETQMSNMYTQIQLEGAIENATKGLFNQEQIEIMINRILEWDTNNDGTIGLIEAIHALQLSTGVKPLP